MTLRHTTAGRLGDLGFALVWVVGALVVAGAVVATGSRTAPVDLAARKPVG